MHILHDVLFVAIALGITLLFGELLLPHRVHRSRIILLLVLVLIFIAATCRAESSAAFAAGVCR